MLLTLTAWSEVREDPSLLSAAEAALLAGLKVPKRRREWLLGRLAVKAAIARHLRRRGDQPPPSAQIEVLPNVDRVPTVTLPAGLAPVQVSISHRAELAVVGVADVDACEGFGVDIERIEARSEAFVSQWLSEGEQSLVSAAPPERQRELTAGIWSAKEAALKAAKKGLSVSADYARVDAIGPGGALNLIVHPSLTRAAVTGTLWTLPEHVIAFVAFGAQGAAISPLPPHAAAWPADPVELASERRASLKVVNSPR